MAGHERLGDEPSDDEETEVHENSESDSDEDASALNWRKITKKLATFANNLLKMNQNYEQIRKENKKIRKEMLKLTRAVDRHSGQLEEFHKRVEVEVELAVLKKLNKKSN